MAWLLLPQFVALLLGAAAIAHAAGRGPRILEPPSRLRAGAVGAALVAAVGTAAIADRLLAQRRDSVEATAAERATRGGREVGADVALVELARARIPRGATYHMVAGARGDREATYQWLTYRLYPRRATSRAEADWIVGPGRRVERARP